MFYSVPKVSGFRKKTFAYNMCVLCNGLPGNVKQTQSIHSFRLGLKEYFLDLLV